jgi:30S ribosomal protein S31
MILLIVRPAQSKVRAGLAALVSSRYVPASVPISDFRFPISDFPFPISEFQPMGKGDKRSKKGKIRNGTYGKRRASKKNAKKAAKKKKAARAAA